MTFGKRRWRWCAVHAGDNNLADNFPSKTPFHERLRESGALSIPIYHMALKSDEAATSAQRRCFERDQVEKLLQNARLDWGSQH